MAYKLKTNKKYQRDLKNIYEYIYENWGESAADKFIHKIDKKIHLLFNHPQYGRPSSKKNSVRKVSIPLYNSLYYRLSGNQIILLRIIDNRINPANNPFQ